MCNRSKLIEIFLKIEKVKSILQNRLEKFNVMENFQEEKQATMEAVNVWLNDINQEQKIIKN